MLRERQRKVVQEQTGSLDEYLGALGLKMTIERFDAKRHASGPCSCCKRPISSI